MLPFFQAIHDDVQLFLVSWSSKLNPTKLLALKCNRVPILHEHPTESEIAYIDVDFKQFGEAQIFLLQG
jgi:hypothetical protein